MAHQHVEKKRGEVPKSCLCDLAILMG